VVRFGSIRQELEELGVVLVGVSGDSPFVHAAWAERLQPGYPFLSDYNREGSRAFEILADQAFGCYRPLNVRAAFLVDRDGIVRHAGVSDFSVLPSPEAALVAARDLQRGK
jgi:peroxiredoxin